MQADHFMYSTSKMAESRAKIWCQWGAFGPLVAWAAVRSGAAVLLLFVYCNSHCGSL